MQTLRTGARTPFFATDITHYVSIATADFSPIEDQPAALTATQEELYTKSGFIVSNATDNSGVVYVITWNEFQIHRTQSNRALVTDLQVLALCTPIRIYLASGDWTMTPIVKVYADNNQTTPSTVVTINVGTVR
jgi:hypothetical protein